MFKSKLQELCHHYSWGLPEYTLVKDGPDHNPRFSATITVNGVTFQTQPDQCRSSKAAQNQAAMLAFNHFTAPKTFLQRPRNSTLLPNAPIPSSSSGYPTSNANLDIGPTNGRTLQPPQQENVQTLKTKETPFSCKDNMASKDMLHLYKNRLQNYAQKRNHDLPMYSCEINGPPHVRRFKSRVTFDGKTYETHDFFPTLKEAEHAAAKVAFESLSLDEVQEGEGLYKSLLQELAQKEGVCFPAYNTAKSGPPHMPTFVSTVEMGGEIFQGQEAKTKKQAEMNAAKAAYTGFTELQGRQNPNPSGCHLEFSSNNLQSIVTDELKPNIRPKAKLLPPEEQAEEDKETGKNAKRYRCSSSSDILYASLRDPFPSSFCSLEDGLSTPSEHSANSVVESDMETAGGGEGGGSTSLARHKVLVCPRKPDITYPDGVTLLPFSDDKWVAVRVDANQNH